MTDLTDLGQAHDALAAADAVVHFAAIPAPGIRPEGETFRINALSTYNVFQAAVDHHMKRVVWASSETVLGLPFDIPPAFAPIDEIDRPAPGVVVFALEARRRDDGDAVRPPQRDRRSSGCGSRTSWSPTDYAAFPSYWDDAPHPQVEPVGLRRRARRGGGRATRAGGRRSRAPRWRSSPPPRRA